MIRALCFAAIAFLSTTELRAQADSYTPFKQLPNGREIVLVYIGAESCGPCHDPAVKDAVIRMKALAAAQARKSGASFSAIGVANDWDVRVAAEFLATAGTFDQVVLGGNFTNLAIEQFVWRDPEGEAVMPQVLVLERTVKQSVRLSFSEPHILRHLRGSDEIPAWVREGAPITPR